MNKEFKDAVATMEGSCEKLEKEKPRSITDIVDKLSTKPPFAEGVYLFSENGKHLYSGRTSNLRQRLKQHINTKGISATYAYKLANLADEKFTDIKKKCLMEDENFLNILKEMGVRISNMDVRFVEEKNPIRQALLEIYVHLELKTTHNDFDNH